MMTLMRQIALGRWNLGRTTSAGSPFVHFRRGVASLGLFAACIQPHLEAAPAAGAMPDGAPRLIRLVAGATRAYDRASAGVAAAHAAGKRGEPFSMRRTEWLVPNRRPVAKSARLEAVLDEYSNGREEASFYVTPGGLSAYFVVSGRKRAAFVFQRWAGSRVLEFTLRHGIRSPAAKSLIRALRQCTNGNIPAWFASTQRALPPPVSVSVPIPRLPGHFRVFSYYPMLRFGHFRASIRPCRVVWFSRGAETILRLEFGRHWPASGIPPLRSYQLWAEGRKDGREATVIYASIGFSSLAEPIATHFSARGLKKLGFAVTKVQPGAQFPRGKATRAGGSPAPAKMADELAEWVGVGPAVFEPPPTAAGGPKGEGASHASAPATVTTSGSGLKTPKLTVTEGHGTTTLASLTLAKLPIVRSDAEKGRSWAMVDMGLYYAAGRVVPRDYAKAMTWYRRAAAKGNSLAMIDIGGLYFSGQGVRQSYAKALRWLLRAASLGNSGAMNDIGSMYALGDGVKRSGAKALKWFHRAAALGNDDAMAGLGLAYQTGLGGNRNYAKAMEWYRKAAAAGNGPAMLRIGSIYQAGLGVPRDPTKAIAWYRRAFKAGDTLAPTVIASIYLNGTGVPRNYVKAMKWLRKAAAAGYAPAMTNIGVMYFHGWGVPKSTAKAKAWFEKAAAAGNQKAKQALEEMKVLASLQGKGK